MATSSKKMNTQLEHTCNTHRTEEPHGRSERSPQLSDDGSRRDALETDKDEPLLTVVTARSKREWIGPQPAPRHAYYYSRKSPLDSSECSALSASPDSAEHALELENAHSFSLVVTTRLLTTLSERRSGWICCWLGRNGVDARVEVVTRDEQEEHTDHSTTSGSRQRSTVAHSHTQHWKKPYGTQRAKERLRSKTQEPQESATATREANRGEKCAEPRCNAQSTTGTRGRRRAAHDDRVERQRSSDVAPAKTEI